MNFHAATQFLRDRGWVTYVLAVLGPCTALWIRMSMGAALDGAPFLTFFPFVLVIALLGGNGPGLVCAVLSTFMATMFMLGTDHPVAEGTSKWVGPLFFVLIAAATISLAHYMNRAISQLSVAKDELRRLNEQLEVRIADRTRQLVETNAQLEGEIAQRETAEAQIRQVQKMQAVGQLTGGIAHDFNNMLAVVIGSLDIAQRRLKHGNDDIVRFIDNAMDGAQRAANLTDRLLAFSRQQPLAPAVIDVNSLVSGMSELLRRTLGEHISLECVLAGGLWRTRVDPGQLENAIVNLSVNARDAMPGGGRLTIETLNGHLDDDYAFANVDVTPGQYVVVAVSDTGTGMSRETIERAFDPFYTTKEFGRGTGLGLSQVHGFVKQSSGHVKIYSEQGQGTSVKIYLRREMERQGWQAIDAKPDLPVPPGTTAEIILVVEDEDHVRATTVEGLRELGYSVTDAASGQEALDILKRQPGIGLLFTDVVMPGLNGRKLADAARRLYPGLKVLYTTGYTPNAIVHSGVVDHGVELITKPFSLDQLARKVRQVLDGNNRQG